MDSNKRENDSSSFAKALGAFDGARCEFDSGSSKMLRFMLEQPEGCDAWLSSERFHIRFGWHPARHRYFVHAGPGPIGRLLDLAKAPLGTFRVQAVIGPETIPALGKQEDLRMGDFFPAWSFGLRRIWLEATSTEIAVHVRGAETEDAGLRTIPQPLPEPIEFEQRVLAFPDSFACPHCAVRLRTFRQLSDGYLVCASCGRSFALSPP